MTDGRRRKKGNPFRNRERARVERTAHDARDAPKCPTESRRTRFSRIPGRSTRSRRRYVNIRVVGVVCDANRRSHQKENNTNNNKAGGGGVWRQRRQKRRRLSFFFCFFFAFFFRVLFLLLWVENENMMMCFVLNTKGGDDFLYEEEELLFLELLLRVRARSVEKVSSRFCFRDGSRPLSLSLSFALSSSNSSRIKACSRIRRLRWR